MDSKTSDSGKGPAAKATPAFGRAAARKQSEKNSKTATVYQTSNPNAPNYSPF